MKKFEVTVIRKQKWIFDIEAESAEEAKEKADEMAGEDAPYDDWAYSTEAREITYFSGK